MAASEFFALKPFNFVAIGKVDNYFISIQTMTVVSLESGKKSNLAFVLLNARLLYFLQNFVSLFIFHFFIFIFYLILCLHSFL